MIHRISEWEFLWFVTKLISCLVYSESVSYSNVPHLKSKRTVMEATLMSDFLELGWKYINNDITMELKTLIKIDRQKCNILEWDSVQSWCSWQGKGQSLVDWVQKEFMTLISHLWMSDKELKKALARDQHSSLQLALLCRETRNGTGWVYWRRVVWLLNFAEMH